MSLLDGLFGAGAWQSGQTDSAAQANSIFNQRHNNSAQNQLGQQAAFNSALNNMNQNPYAGRNWVSHNWVFNSKPCTLQEFADAVWGTEDHEDKMLFLLTHSGPDKK